MKTNIFVIYGGQSAEHEVSLITAQTVIQSLDRSRYRIVPIYISEAGNWHCQGELAGNSNGDSLSAAAPKPHDITIDMLKMSGKAAESRSLTPVLSLAEVMQTYWSTNEPKVVFPVIHGTFGEDGTLQGLLEMLQLPYVGSGVLASAAGMDKETMKHLLSGLDIGQASYRTLLFYEWRAHEEQICAELEVFPGFPCYVKPANMGSSIGINRCKNRDELKAALKTAFQYDHKLLIEEEIVGREVQFAVLGNEEPQCSVGGEFVREADFFDYEKKYKSGRLIKQIPARITAGVEQHLRESALRIYKRLGGSGLMRIDFFVTAEDQCYFNEVNTLPGFTMNSMFPALWEATDGTTYGELLDRLIELAMERYKNKQSIRLVRG